MYVAGMMGACCCRYSVPHRSPGPTPIPHACSQRGVRATSWHAVLHAVEGPQCGAVGVLPACRAGIECKLTILQWAHRRFSGASQQRKPPASPGQRAGDVVREDRQQSSCSRTSLKGVNACAVPPAACMCSRSGWACGHTPSRSSSQNAATVRQSSARGPCRLGRCPGPRHRGGGPGAPKSG
jgi:hypothetical protein